MDIQKVIKAFERNHYTVRYFETGKEAADYLNGQIDGQTVGFGDSATMHEIGLYNLLHTHNTVFDPYQTKDNDEFLEAAKKCMDTDVFLTSVNALSETGEMVNIDGTGNRVAASLFGHKKVYFVASTNKIEPTLEKAVWRARNVAGPKNAKKYNLPTPCVIKGGGCYNCSSPVRICNALNIYLKKMNDLDEAILVLINEEHGF